MTFPAEMRLGSFEIVATLAVFAVAAGRTRRPRVQPAAGAPSRIEVEIHESGSRRQAQVCCPALVGRSSDADLALNDPEVSRSHARFDAEGGVVYVTDLHSRNGTFLNGERITEGIEVRAGDHIDMGNARLTILRSGSWT